MKVLNLIKNVLTQPRLSTMSLAASFNTTKDGFLQQLINGNFDLTFASSEARSDSYCDQGIGLGILLLTALGIGIMGFTLYTKVTMAMLTRRSPNTSPFGYLEDILFSGKAK